MTLSLVLAALLRSQAVSAEPRVPASAIDSPGRAGLERGVALRKSGEDRLALAEFERAYALDASAEALAQIALAEQALGRWLDARAHIESALKLHADDTWIAKHRTTLESALKQIEARLGMLEVSCNVAGAEIRLDGSVLGRTPLDGPLRLVAGESVIQLAAPGYFELTRLVQVDAGSLSRLDVALIPRASSARPAEEPPAPTANAGVAPRAAHPPARHASEASASSARSVLMYTSLGLAAAGVAVGATGYVMREVNLNLYNDDSRCARTLGLQRSEECPNEAAAWRRGEALAIAGFSAAAVFGTTGLFLWLTRPKPVPQKTLACALGVASVSCRGHF